MNAFEVIDSYVRDVAGRLPRAKRNDVAFELRSLLGDSLAAKAQEAGRTPDEAMAIDIVRGFGRPADTAARYHQPPAVIDPADTHHFFIWALAGATAISAFAPLNPPATSPSDAFLKWIGALVVIFAIIAWWRRTHPLGQRAWKPRLIRDLYHANRWVCVTYAILTLIPLTAYAAPVAFAHVFFLGAIPTHGVRYDSSFIDHPLYFATVTALAMQPLVYMCVAIEGRWRRWSRFMIISAFLAIGALLAAHAGLARQGQIFVVAEANTVSGPIYVVVGACMSLCFFYEIYREWSRIAPAPELQAAKA